MEAKSVERLPLDGGWQFEPKWDGFRCLAFKANGNVDLRARSGKPLTRYFPEMVAALSSAEADNFVLDGELTLPIGDTLNFAAFAGPPSSGGKPGQKACSKNTCIAYPV